MKKKPNFLHRYTSNKILNSILKKKELPFSVWKHWIDENDKKLLELYQNKTRKSVFVLCMTNWTETIHHWSIYANKNGRRITFNMDLLLHYLEKNGVIYKEVEYVKINDLRKKGIAIEDLPFIKRHPYNIEKEFRLIKTLRKNAKEFKLKIDYDIIAEISLSPFNDNKHNEREKNKLIKKYPFLEKKISNSKILNYDKWINHFEKLGFKE